MDFIQDNAVFSWWLTGISLFTFLASLIVIPWLLLKIPANYFSGEKRPPLYNNQHHPQLLQWMFLIVKNLLGFLFVIAGIIMLVLPGQGILTILLGLALMNFPGKYSLERWLVTHGPTLKWINHFRQRHGKPPLIIESAG